MNARIQLGSRTKIRIVTAVTGLAVAAGFGLVAVHGAPAATGTHAVTVQAAGEPSVDSGEGPNP